MHFKHAMLSGGGVSFFTFGACFMCFVSKTLSSNHSARALSCTLLTLDEVVSVLIVVDLHLLSLDQVTTCLD